MVCTASPRYCYTVDGGDLVTSVTPLWLAFAQENGARDLTAPSVLRHSLWKFIEGVETVQLYKAILHRVRTRNTKVILPFRCDSPNLKRYMRLEISGQPSGHVHFDSVLQHVQAVDKMNLLDQDFPRSQSVLTLCSLCKRALVEPNGWLEIEDAAVQLKLLEKQRAPKLRHGLCPDCLTMSAL